MKTTTKGILTRLAITTVATSVMLAVLWAADPPADETATVTVKTRPRIMRAVVDYDEAGNITKVDAYLFRLRLDNDVLVNQQQLGSKTWTRDELIAADGLRSNLVMRLEGFSTWAKAHWNDIVVVPIVPENP